VVLIPFGSQIIYFLLICKTTDGPGITLSHQSGNGKITIKFNVTNIVNAAGSDQETDSDIVKREQTNTETSQLSTQLKSRPTFTVDINHGRQILSFLCSYLGDDYPDVLE
ncbi:unnamed protein product, partial [Rotaria sp. Silwood1]